MHRLNKMNKQRKYCGFSSFKNLGFSKKADIPGWAQVVGLIIALMVIILLIWFSVKSGKASVELFSRT